MQLKTYANYKRYYRDQVRSDAKKSPRLSVFPEEADRIVEYLREKRGEPSRGICHGVRYGQEVLMFRERFPNAVVMGTDLLPREEDHVIQWDFHEQKPEWIGGFDFLYTNSLDHSHSPRDCVRTWLEQLKPTGLAFLQWSDGKLNTQGGDCFGATLHEYLIMLNDVGEVQDLLWLGLHNCLLDIVVRPRVGPSPWGKRRRRRRKRT